MQNLTEERVGCPYCGELISVLLDVSDANEEYIEDCQVCCRPIIFSLTTDIQGEVYVSVRSENETY